MTNAHHVPPPDTTAAQDMTPGNSGCAIARRPGDVVAGVVGAGFELRFESLFVEGRALSFPCDAQGQVDLATLTPRARDNYLRARAQLGREFSTPAVRHRDLH